MAQVLAEQTPWWAEGPALDPLGPLMHFQAQQGCHPSTQAVTCVTNHFLEQLVHINCPQAHLDYTNRVVWHLSVAVRQPMVERVRVGQQGELTRCSVDA
ncbi:MAG: hypothetical protein FRX49_01840 [Trebouxia sp. A1-2]|nr:MAG: hypothetical protein FRX49_01840 [Trebouxia sp. A1-2]